MAVRAATHQIRDDIKNGVGNDGQDGAARDPLQLLPQNGRAGVPVAVPEHDRLR